MWFFSLLLKYIHQTSLFTSTLRSLFSKLSLGVSWHTKKQCNQTSFAALKINIQ